jgi:DegV family protein with EDD domain
MPRVAVITDSASDLEPAEAAEAGFSVVPLIVTFGADSYKAGVEMSAQAFWERMTAPDAPFPTTAASSPGDFRDAYEAAFAAGAEAIVSIHVAATLSGTIKSAQIARDMLADREIHIVDSQGASRAQAILARVAVAMAADGTAAAEIAEYLTRRTSDLRTYVALETLEYLKKGGRISGTRAAIGTLLSVKPIISVEGGVVDTPERVRTRAKARERLIEMITARPIERLEILHTITPDVEQFRDEVLARATGSLDPATVTIALVGASVGPHVGPGCLGAAVLYESGA